ncbi:MAG: phosphate ABC transporter permease subunit PstC [Omnitrophica WOR_2 bacterium GWF2_38_59]|nr:MAG: phosphate ABC transporter permease subunit PstC [Omnitrophica WOR_2 bacterium GWF2_38_59]OGX48339.1 MAG: phosphate ABC transporter permease subunit PstC [Omnitrophica WOR_2 bacterium RIFOXYA2_FULL_38_17]OGX53153.1 MAG: phosphate ABC transporter permease subunit PstC [Omnitrophica WOR_2 bacterium RIFOXYA12_FULL_38_10]OGX55079.1 MAG: phosphate ABC transporter permease subunit PstC [Omnitrophica WOR_2 bacterium RIFOXYC2_FULL_38_12]OGX58067.1 MAG: phosphate ABC transporter permease subunit 
MRKVKEFIIEKLILICGLASIFFVGLIFLFLLKEGLSVFNIVTPLDFLFGKSWYPISDPAQLGILPLILGSLLVTLGAAVISIPIGIGCAIYIAEIAPARIKEVLKAGIELLAAIPSVVLGFIGMITLVPFVKNCFHLPTGLTALSGSIMLAFMAMPTIVSIAEDALYSVPKTYKEGALALGATHWQTIWRVMLPAASSGLLAAIMLGIGRVIGETMAVMMITGNAAVMPNTILEPIRTLTATIAAEMGEAVVGSEHYFALFAIGIVLFIISFAINVTADLFLHRKQ